ncbi:30S ribosomal protein S18 [Yersinia mollaretii ATCC 43969]|uniref:30S ribosomal protein S18 n=1 Tax=Yersinia mollaretii (strain ATCC 43969 / DSM 18520 / CIP 103324 / CNY 7263 / WAIP 204) TaxID=349967 RepID=A0ABM9Y941_YERMW|nr:30S ribosomal protein S18 [Yersinia mollaretii ATCC 43969]
MDSGRLLMTISVRQQRQVASALDTTSELTLEFCTSTGNTARNNFTTFSDIVFQRSDVFIINLYNAFRGETAELATTEITCH